MLFRHRSLGTGPKFSSWIWLGPYEVILEEHPRYVLKCTGVRRTRNAVHARRLIRSHMRQGADGGDDINYAPAAIENETQN